MTDVLRDLLQNSLRVVLCGTAAGTTSAAGGQPAINLSVFDEEEYEALYTAEWGVGWKLNERAINMRQVIAQSLMEFLGITEPENSIVLGG